MRQFSKLCIAVGLTISLPGYAAQYVYDDLNRLIQVVYSSGKIIYYTYDPTGNIINISTKEEHTQCLLYAVHDKNRQDSQFFTVNPQQNFNITLLGPLHPHQDIEALDIHPVTNQIFAAAGDDGEYPGHLYQVHAQSGELTHIGATTFSEINGLSFKPDGSLWGWAEGEGLIKIDNQTGLATLEVAYDGPIEDITWDNQGVILYGVLNGQLLAYDGQTTTMLNCTLPGGEIEALEMLPDGQLLFSIHNDKTLSIHALNINSCELTGVTIDTKVADMKLNDVEGIAWPLSACAQ